VTEEPTTEEEITETVAAETVVPDPTVVMAALRPALEPHTIGNNGKCKKSGMIVIAEAKCLMFISDYNRNLATAGTVGSAPVPSGPDSQADCQGFVSHPKADLMRKFFDCLNDQAQLVERNNETGLFETSKYFISKMIAEVVPFETDYEQKGAFAELAATFRTETAPHAVKEKVVCDLYYNQIYRSNAKWTKFMNTCSKH
jgi:hypothetical protein